MIKKEKIGVQILTRIGWVTIKEGKEELYKKLNLDIFEDEPKLNQGSDDKQRSTKPKRKNNSIDSDISI